MEEASRDAGLRSPSSPMPPSPSSAITPFLYLSLPYLTLFSPHCLSFFLSTNRQQIMQGHAHTRQWCTLTCPASFSVCGLEYKRLVLLIYACCLYACVCTHRYTPTSVCLAVLEESRREFVYIQMGLWVLSVINSFFSHWPVSQLSTALIGILQATLLCN